tara:strand:+ start:977 stop:1528 length:552 start_codon:yes stop_codon:yes gene_type:complete
MSESTNENNEVFEQPPKPKRKRKALTEEQKEVLRERLKKARESKSKNKNKPKITIESKPLSTIPEDKEVIIETAPEVLKEPEPKSEPAPNNEMLELQSQLNKMRLEKLEAIELKNEKKKLAVKKRKETIARKALQKKLAENEVAKPAPERKPTPVVEPEAEPMEVKVATPRYSTFKRSVWANL